MYYLGINRYTIQDYLSCKNIDKNSISSFDLVMKNNYFKPTSVGIY